MIISPYNIINRNIIRHPLVDSVEGYAKLNLLNETSFNLTVSQVERLVSEESPKQWEQIEENSKSNDIIGWKLGKGWYILTSDLSVNVPRGLEGLIIPNWNAIVMGALVQSTNLPPYYSGPIKYAIYVPDEVEFNHTGGFAYVQFSDHEVPTVQVDRFAGDGYGARPNVNGGYV